MGSFKKIELSHEMGLIDTAPFSVVMKFIALYFIVNGL